MTIDSDSTQAADALAWSQSDEPFFENYVDVDGVDDLDGSRWRTWPLTLAAWAAAVLAFVVGVAILTNTTQPPSPANNQQQPMATWTSLNAGTVAPSPADRPENT